MPDYNLINWSDFVCYDEASPTFLRWKIDRRNGKGGVLKVAGDIAGGFNKNGYTITKILDLSYLNHRIIWIMFNGHIPDGYQIDHIDGCRSNNRLENLRLASQCTNSRNMACYNTNTSGVSGVRLYKNRYYTARWRNLGGEQKEKYFSISKLGEDIAFKLACEYRKAMIEELNRQGAGYTERHGT